MPCEFAVSSRGSAAALSRERRRRKWHPQIPILSARTTASASRKTAKFECLAGAGGSLDFSCTKRPEQNQCNVSSQADNGPNNPDDFGRGELLTVRGFDALIFDFADSGTSATLFMIALTGIAFLRLGTNQEEVTGYLAPVDRLVPPGYDDPSGRLDDHLDVDAAIRRVFSVAQA